MCHVARSMRVRISRCAVIPNILVALPKALAKDSPIVYLAPLVLLVLLSAAKIRRLLVSDATKLHIVLSTTVIHVTHLDATGNSVVTRASVANICLNVLERANASLATKATFLVLTLCWDVPNMYALLLPCLCQSEVLAQARMVLSVRLIHQTRPLALHASVGCLVHLPPTCFVLLVMLARFLVQTTAPGALSASCRDYVLFALIAPVYAALVTRP